MAIAIKALVRLIAIDCYQGSIKALLTLIAIANTAP
jgi:hypothetical protein